MLSFFLMLNFVFLLNQSGLASDNLKHDHCDRIGDFCHHDPGIACLKRNKELVREMTFLILLSAISVQIYTN